MPFRTYRPFGLPAWEMLPSADGQLGAVVRLYREWRLSGDNRLIEDCWDGVVRSMEYAIRTWDTDGDFVPDSAQHVTYDTELYGMTSMVSTCFLPRSSPPLKWLNIWATRSVPDGIVTVRKRVRS